MSKLLLAFFWRYDEGHLTITFLRIEPFHRTSNGTKWAWSLPKGTADPLACA